MLTEKIIENSLNLINQYCPNLLIYLRKEEFISFLSKAIEHTENHNGGTPDNSFIVTFFKLVEEVRFNKSFTIRYEFSYFNHLLGEFSKYENKKEFRNLIRAVLFNFRSNNFHHILGEIAACLDLSLKLTFNKYEQTLTNNKSVDFEFFNINNDIIYIDVLTIDYNKAKYERENFETFLHNRLKAKFESKTENLDLNIKKKFFVYPILSGFTIEIIKEQSDYLIFLKDSILEKDGFQTFPPRVFGSIQGTFFNLFYIDEIIDPEKIKKRYRKHMI